LRRNSPKIVLASKVPNWRGIKCEDGKESQEIPEELRTAKY